MSGVLVNVVDVGCCDVYDDTVIDHDDVDVCDEYDSGVM